VQSKPEEEELHMLRKVSILTCVALAIVLAPAAQALTVTVDEGVQYQTIEGWGACQYPDENRDPSLYVDQRWRDAFRDAGMNIIRLNVTPAISVQPGGDHEGPEAPMTGDLAADAATFNFEQESFKYSDELAAWLHQGILEPERAKVVGGIWSVCHWAKAPTGAFLSNGRWSGGTPVLMYVYPPSPGCSCGGTWDTGIWQQDRYQYNARWLAAFCYGFEQHSGVPLYGLSCQNEVAYEQPFDSCTLYHVATAQKGTRQSSETTMDYNVYANAMKATKDEFGLHPELDHILIMGPHHAGLHDDPTSPWGLLFQMSGIQAVKDHADPNLLDFVDVYTHNYGTSPAKRAEMFRAYWEGMDSMPDEPWPTDWYYPPCMYVGIVGDARQTWNSEFGGHEWAWPGPLDLALDAHTQLVWGHESAIIYWQLLTSGNSGGSVHELLSMGTLDNPEDSLKYCAYKQFSRYVRPGAARVSATFNENGWTCYGTSDDMDDENSINVSAYVHAADGRVTVVMVNMTGTGYPVDVVLPSSPAVSTCSVYRTSSAEHFVHVGNVPVSGGTVSVTVPAQSIVTVTGAGAGQNVAPVANDDAYSTPLDTTLNVSAPGVLGNDTDPNGDDLSAIKVSDPSHGSVDLNSDGSFAYTPDTGYTGEDSFTYKANDGQADSNTATVTITVGVVNDPPVANDDSYSTPQDTILNVGAPGVLANDSDPNEDPLTAVKISDPSHGEVVLNSDGSFEYTPDNHYTGDDSFTYVANDGLADSNTATVSITVTAGDTMHVDAVTASAVPFGAGCYGGRADVVIVDYTGAPVEGAEVTGTFTKPNETITATTNAAGLAVLETANCDHNIRNQQFCVDNVTHPDYVYDPDANVETCDTYTQ
jgi:VCBS repeat-containing protein